MSILGAATSQHRPPERRPTQTSQVLDVLRQDIISGTTPPGSRLVVATLAERLSTSQTPVREALMRLASEGMVTLEDQRGFSVAPVSPDELLQLTRARTEIEAIVLRWSIERGTDEWEGRVLGDMHRLRKATLNKIENQVVTPAWEIAHQSFHRTLVSQCDNAILLELREALFQRSTRYRCFSVRYREHLQENLEFHEQMARAVVDRSVPKAVQLMTDHILTAANHLLEEFAQSN